MRKHTDHDRMVNRWSALDVPPTALEEMVLVPCGGCEHNPQVTEILSEIAEDSLPHTSSLVSLTSLVEEKDMVSRYRYEHADSTVAISGCSEKCTVRSLESFTAPHIELLMDPTATREQQQEQLLQALRQYSDLAKLEKQSSWSQPLAARVAQKSFLQSDLSGVLQQETEHSVIEAKALEDASSSPRVQSKVRFSRDKKNKSAPQTGGYFRSKQKSKKHRWLIPVMVAGLLFVLGFGIQSSGWFVSHSAQKDTTSKASALLAKSSHSGKSLAELPKEMKSIEAPGNLAIKPSRREKAVQAIKQTREVLTPKPSARKQTAETTDEQPMVARRRSPPVHRERGKQPEVTKRVNSVKNRDLQVISQEMSREDSQHWVRTKMVNKKWIGGVCKNQTSCGYSGAMCALSVSGGLCTTFCNKYCPDKKNRWNTVSYCVSTDHLRRYMPALPALSHGLCMSKCDYQLFPKSGCRMGTRCMNVPLRRNPKIKKSLCIPVARPSNKHHR